MQREMVPAWGAMRRVTLYLPVDQLAGQRELAAAGCGNTSEQIRLAIEAHLEGRARPPKRGRTWSQSAGRKGLEAE